MPPRGEFWAIATSLVRMLFVTVLTGFSDATTCLTVKMLISAFSLPEAVWDPVCDGSKLLERRIVSRTQRGRF